MLQDLHLLSLRSTEHIHIVKAELNPHINQMNKHKQVPPCHFLPLWRQCRSALHLPHRSFGSILCTEPADRQRIILI